MQLRANGYRFYTVSRSFVTHMPHPQSNAKLVWKRGVQRYKNDKLLTEYVVTLTSSTSVENPLSFQLAPTSFTFSTTLFDDALPTYQPTYLPTYH